MDDPTRHPTWGSPPICLDPDESFHSPSVPGWGSMKNVNQQWWEKWGGKFQDLFGTFLKLDKQHRLKHIDVSKHVLRTYHDSFLFGEVPIFVRIRAALRVGVIGFLWHILEFVFAVLSGALYVYSTYHLHEGHEWVGQTQNFVSIVFVADYMLRVFSEPVRLHYVLSFRGLIDLLSALPIIFLFKSTLNGGSILRLLQFLRIVRIFSLISTVGVVGSTVAQQIILLVVSTFGVVFLDAGIIQWVEYEAAPKHLREKCSYSGCINFWDSFYYIIVTISTVGYGDITPKTELGRLICIITIIAALVILPIQIRRITYLASRSTQWSRPYGGSSSARKVIDSRYLIVSGSISYQAVQDWLAEFYNPTHSEDLETYPLRVTILAPFSPSFELNQLVALYNGLVEFIEGSPVRQSDLERVFAARASAFFLLADQETDAPKEEDAKQIVRALAVHRFCGNQVRIIVEVLEPGTQTSAVWDETQSGGIEVICPAKIHYKMLSCSCTIKGLYTFITNLFTSEIKLMNLSDHHFISEYVHGFDNEVYPLIFPSACHNKIFEEVESKALALLGRNCWAAQTQQVDASVKGFLEESGKPELIVSIKVAEFVFMTFDCVLFALDVTVLLKEKNRSIRKVLLHPKGHIIQPHDIGFVISKDLHTAFSISQYGDKKLQLRLCERLWANNEEHQAHYSNSTDDDGKLESVKNRWKRTGTVTVGNYTRESMVDTDETIDRPDPRTFPVSPEGHYKLESQLGSAIRRVLEDHRKEQDHTGEIDSLPRSINEHHSSHDVLTSKSSTEGANGAQVSKGLSLENAIEKLLAWPPLSHFGQPHPAVLERKADIILQDLQKRTVSVVELNLPHILVCCQGRWPRHIFYFLRELRKPGFPNPPIVIMHPNEPSAKQWGLVGIFHGVFFLKGSPVYELDLMLAGVLQAEKVVILADQGRPLGLRGADLEDVRYRTKVSSDTSDVDNVLIAANVERLVGEKTEIMVVEMQHTVGFYYLPPQYQIPRSKIDKMDYKRNRDAMVHFTPPYMEGKVVSPSLLGFLLRSTFYNRNTVSIVEQLVEGGYVTQDGCLSAKPARHLKQIKVPGQYVNRPYTDLFLGLLRDEGILALGLYRARATLGSPTAYVFTNPPRSIFVQSADLVYVLA